MVALSSCQTLSNANISALAAPLKASLVAGDLGTGLDNPTLAVAANAEYRALETANAGASVNWRVSDKVFGTVTPQQPYTVGTTNCRRYTHSINVNGTPRAATGTACRGDDGVWTPLT
jgi:surface antigen